MKKLKLNKKVILVLINSHLFQLFERLTKTNLGSVFSSEFEHCLIGILNATKSSYYGFTMVEHLKSRRIIFNYVRRSSTRYFFWNWVWEKQLFNYPAQFFVCNAEYDISEFLCYG